MHSFTKSIKPTETKKVGGSMWAGIRTLDWPDEPPPPPPAAVELAPTAPVPPPPPPASRKICNIVVPGRLVYWVHPTLLAAEFARITVRSASEFRGRSPRPNINSRRLLPLLPNRLQPLHQDLRRFASPQAMQIPAGSQSPLLLRLSKLW